MHVVYVRTMYVCVCWRVCMYASMYVCMYLCYVCSMAVAKKAGMYICAWHVCGYVRMYAAYV